MKFYIDIATRRFVRGPTSSIPLDRLFLKRRDKIDVEVIFVEKSAVVATPTGTNFSTGLKTNFSDTAFLALSDSTGLLDLYTTAIEALFADDPASVSALLEVKTSRPGEETRASTLGVDIENSVILGDEGTPPSMPSLKATSADATAGTSNEKWMTPLRTAEAIAELAPAPTWNGLTGKPSTFPPSAHTHAATEITDFSAAVVAILPPVDWGTIPGKPSVFPPSSHTHQTSEVTGLNQNLADLEAADIALGQRIDHLNANLDPSALDSIAEAASSINSLQNQLNTHTHTSAEITDFSSAVVALSPPVDWSSLPGKPSNFPPASHTHNTNQVLGLQAALDGKQTAGSYAAATHTHTASEISDFASAVGAVSPPADWGTLTGKPATFPPDVHTHATSEITGLDSALANKQPLGSYATAAQGAKADTASQPGHTHAISEITGLADALAAKMSAFIAKSAVSGRTIYTGRAAPATAESAAGWTIRRTVTNSAGSVTSSGTASGAWDQRASLVYA